MLDLETVRSWYAQELRFVAAVKSAAIVRAFAAVPRERFLGPGPWSIYAGPGPDKYWPTEDADPRHVYHNVVIGLIPERGLNNGQPGLWASLFDQLDLGVGRRVVHLGCGTGYYTAVLAEIVGGTGQVAAVEIDQGLAARAQQALQPWPQVAVVNTDGATYRPPDADVIVASAGATHPLPVWLDALNPGGRLLLPLTADDWWGRALLVTRGIDGAGYAAKFVGRVGFIAFTGARDPAMGSRLSAAFARGDDETVRSLRREAHAEDETCWLHGDGYCLSRMEVAASDP